MTQSLLLFAIRTNIPILDIPSRLLRMFALDLVIGLLNEMLEEHLGGDGDDEGGIVGALGDVGVGVDDLLDAGD